MNILIPHKWLLEYLDTKATQEEIQKYLSLCGPSVERIYQIQGEPVYDIEITVNRVDSMSVYGIAREATTILNQFNINAKLIEPNFEKIKVNKSIADQTKLIKVHNDPTLCDRTSYIILKNIKRTPTPKWMAKRLKQLDMKIHDSAIDITNYVTHELGHPCHAFDYDKLMKIGGEIIIKQAQKGKKFTTLDGTEYTTVGGEIVFENKKGTIIDLPAIKGTANTSIDNNTKNICLWIESLDPQKVRFASMTHNIRTTAAQLEEKGVDPHLASQVLLKATQLYQKLCQADIASEIIDEFPGDKAPSSIKVKYNTIEKYLGLKLKQSKIKKILQDLGCKTELSSNQIEVTPPTYRPDLTIPADIIEELARIYGYHRLPSIVMDTEIPLNKQKGVDFEIELKAKKFLAYTGWQEIYTYSMVSEVLAKQSGFTPEQHLKIQNPLTQDRVYLRRSLIPSLREAILHNPTVKYLNAFEIANVYHPQDKKLPKEELHLTMVSNQTYRKVIGYLEALLEHFYQPIIIKQNSNNKADILTKKEQYRIGKIQYNNKITAIDIIWEDFLKIARKHPTYHPKVKTSPIIEDLTFKFKQHTNIGEVINQIEHVHKFISQITLKDIYESNYTLCITYLNKDNNLTNQDVESIRKKIVNFVENKYQAELIGEV